jgi:hypothetical protein
MTAQNSALMRVCGNDSALTAVAQLQRSNAPRRFLQVLSSVAHPSDGAQFFRYHGFFVAYGNLQVIIMLEPSANLAMPTAQVLFADLAAVHQWRSSKPQAEIQKDEDRRDRRAACLAIEAILNWTHAENVPEQHVWILRRLMVDLNDLRAGRVPAPWLIA